MIMHAEIEDKFFMEPPSSLENDRKLKCVGKLIRVGGLGNRQEKGTQRSRAERARTP